MPVRPVLNATDLTILSYLQKDPRMSMSSLAEVTSSSVSPCWRRVRRMEEEGVIAGYHLQLNRRSLGYGIDSFLFVTLNTHREAETLEFERAVTAIDKILSCHILSGQDHYLLRVVEADLDAFAQFMRKVVAALPHVREVRSALIMQTVKETHRLPLPGP